ncbi:MAG: protein translocase subunit SecD [Bacteroidales bacterium]|nr:protein translocase subunit SecD [Bacteroidales bacterium]
MQRNFLTRLIICLVPVIIAGVFVGLAARQEAKEEGSGFRRGIDLAGGTILVYEVDLARTRMQAQPQSAGASNPNAFSREDIQRLAENLKRRIDPADLRNVVVRPVGTTRVEIILPFTKARTGEAATEDFVQEVKSLVSQTGQLEFRILANMNDDAAAIDDATNLINSADTDSQVKEQLESVAKTGFPPPVPDKTYETTVNGTVEPDTNYRWVELGREERATLGLSNPKDGAGSGLWQQLASQRGKAVYTGNMLLYSRDFVKEAPSRDEKDLKAEPPIDKKVEYFVLTRVSPSDSLQVGRDVGLTATAGTDDKQDPAVHFRFNSTGANRFGKITERNRPGDGGGMLRNLAIIMDDKIVSAPTLNAVIRESGQISGKSFDMPGVNRLVYILRSGALNAVLKPEPVSENSVGPTLGASTIQKGLISVGLAFAAVLVFMLFYYEFSGIVACVALFANLLLTIGFMTAMSAAFTLPGLAGLVLMLGMAVDANVLIYERIREERDRGANLVGAIRLGYDRAFPTIIDTHLTSIFTAVILYAFGNDNLKGFAVALTLGLVISLFTALYMTRLMFDYATHKRWISHLRMHRLFAKPNINFMAVRKPMFAFTVFVSVTGLLIFSSRGNHILNVDFTKGTAYGGRLVEPRPLNGDAEFPGLLDLLDESNQHAMLKVKEVIWLTEPVADTSTPTADDTAPNKATAAEYIYKVVYENSDGKSEDKIITFANAPEGTSKEEQIADVTARASGLPDHSVEQVFLQNVDDDLTGGRSRSFLVRTTEKEPDLVQVMLDRLLRNKDGQPLLDSTRMTKVEFSGPTATLTFDRPTAPGYLRSFVERELRLANRLPLGGGEQPVEVTGVPSGDAEQIRDEIQSGRFTQLKVSVAGNSEFRHLLTTTGAKNSAASGAVAGGAATKAEPQTEEEKVAAERATEDAAAFQRIVQAAVEAFTTRPLPDRLETFDPALAAETRNSALYAILGSWLAILGYLWFRFGSWTFGLSAVLCLVHDLCFTLGIIALSHFLYDNPIGQLFLLHDFKIDLTAVAALLTLIGFSVNDTIVVFDRLREVRGKNPALTTDMINGCINGTLSRTMLTSLTVFLVVGVLYIFGGEGIHLFSFIMVIGVIVGTISSIYVASPLLLILGEGRSRTPTRTVAPVAAAEIEA